MVDHILQHDLVQENPIAAEFVSTMEEEMQNIKECFNTKMMSILGSKIGQENELCYPSFKNKNRMLLIRDSRDMEDRIIWCLRVNFQLFCTNDYQIKEFILLMNSLNMI